MPENNIFLKEQANLPRIEIIKRNLEKLKHRREIGEIDKENFPLENIFYINDEKYENRPLTRKDLGKKALVLTTREFQQFGLDLLLFFCRMARN